MKGILVALVILQLVLLSKGSSSLPKTPKSCPRNPMLEEWKEAVKQSLATKTGREKRQSATGFPINSCYIFGLFESREDDYVYKPLSDCCEQCRHPKFANCMKSHQLYLCVSRAHKCTCECRENHLSELAGSDNTRSIELQRFKGPGICEKKTCDSKQCCVENQCVKLNVRKDRT
ncbi:Hypothetical predicted protein [Paramuricea clavata]|uniref:Uncharacterized protein n=1 Tax=Paramuricea clavata TaxID=317549 RepID=A0A6S7KZS0_PARCT|nr:Hypothetical predicted protein [Paramuricea clavata]